jgi:hypothetical protein
VGFVFAIVLAKFKGYLAIKFTAEQILIAKETALMVVKTLQQSPAYEAFAPEKKKEFAMIWVSEQLADYGLEFTLEEIDRLIEEAVATAKERL